MISLNSITIDPFHEQDHITVSRLLVNSFQGKFQTLVPLEDDDIANLLIGLWEQDPKSATTQQIVAKENGEVVGTLSLKWKDNRSSDRIKLKSSHPISFSQLFKQFGYLNVCKFMVGLYF